MSKQSRLLVTALDGSAAPPCVDVQLSYTCDRAGAPLTLAAKFTVLSGTQVWKGVRTDIEFQTDVKELLAFDVSVSVFGRVRACVVCTHNAHADTHLLKFTILKDAAKIVSFSHLTSPHTSLQ